MQTMQKRYNSPGVARLLDANARAIHLSHSLLHSPAKLPAYLQRYAKTHLGNLNLGWQWDIVLTHRKGKDFYLLLLGPFDSRGQASEMITRLPETVQNNQPYPRTANSVQRIAK